MTTNHADRDHALLSASSAHRWLACPPSAVAAEAYPRTDTEFTREGTLAHEVAEWRVKWGLPFRIPLTCHSSEYKYKRNKPFPKNRGATQEMLDCAEGYRDYVQEQLKDYDATVLLEQRVDFSPWVPDGFGTADCIIIQGDTMDIIDYKYGKGVAVSAEDNPQMKLYGLGALNEFGFAYDVKTVRLHIYQPRINNVSVYELTADELMVWGAKTVAPIAYKAAKGKGTYTAGEHCRFCPHAGRCRALTKTCTKYIETHGLKASVETLAPWEVADVLRMEPIVSLWLKRVREQALATMLDGGDVPSYKVVAGRGTRTWVDDLEVADLLERAGHSVEEYTKVEILSPAAMEKALGKKKVAELLAGQILSHTGAPTVAPESDKRPKYDRLAEAQTDFND